MAINWRNWSIITTTFGNEIVIAKKKPLKFKGEVQPDLYEIQDRSPDMTEAAVKAVMEHMLRQAREKNKAKCTFTIEGLVQLELIDLTYKEVFDEE